MTAAIPPLPLDGVAPLSHLGVIQAIGPDAAPFLHGQLTQDFVLLGAGEARLAALCTAKGRMIASFIGIRPEPERILLVCSKDILAATLKRLSMFVMRAKVKLTDASDAFALYGVAGSALEANGIDLAAAPGKHTTIGDARVVSLYPADGVARALWIAPANTAAPAGEALDAAAWAWSEVRSGIVTLTTPVVEAFVPQMLNYESVGGVSFKKGCYPGQEIVARSQFRGTLKRRAFLMDASAPVMVGQEVFGTGSDQPVEPWHKPPPRRTGIGRRWCRCKLPRSKPAACTRMALRSAWCHCPTRCWKTSDAKRSAPPGYLKSGRCISMCGMPASSNGSPTAV